MSTYKLINGTIRSTARCHDNIFITPGPAAGHTSSTIMASGVRIVVSKFRSLSVTTARSPNLYRTQVRHSSAFTHVPDTAPTELGK